MTKTEEIRKRMDKVGYITTGHHPHTQVVDEYVGYFQDFSDEWIEFFVQAKYDIRDLLARVEQLEKDFESELGYKLNYEAAQP